MSRAGRRAAPGGCRDGRTGRDGADRGEQVVGQRVLAQETAGAGAQRGVDVLYPALRAAHLTPTDALRTG
jgi:hypothetical protein